MKKQIISFLVILLFTPIGAFAKPGNVTLSTKDGWTLAAIYSPAGAQRKTVILLHDLNKKKEEFTTFSNDLAKAGIGYLAVDLRGHGHSTGRGHVSGFAKEGVDNPFNKMTYDVEAAVSFLKSKGVPADQIVLLGAGLGAQVAAKSAVLSGVEHIALISPSANIRDVLVIPSIRLYKGDVLIAASAGDKKGFLEASVIRNVAFLTTGEGKVTFLTAYDFSSHELLDKYLRGSVMQWIKTPRKPDLAPDARPSSTLSSVGLVTDTSGIPVEGSATEDALVPSVLGGI